MRGTRAGDPLANAVYNTYRSDLLEHLEGILAERDLLPHPEVPARDAPLLMRTQACDPPAQRLPPDVSYLDDVALLMSGGLRQPLTADAHPEP